MDLDRALENMPDSARINAAHEHCEGMAFVRELTGSGTTEEKPAFGLRLFKWS